MKPANVEDKVGAMLSATPQVEYHLKEEIPLEEGQQVDEIVTSLPVNEPSGPAGAMSTKKEQNASVPPCESILGIDDDDDDPIVDFASDKQESAPEDDNPLTTFTKEVSTYQSVLQVLAPIEDDTSPASSEPNLTSPLLAQESLLYTEVDEGAGSFVSESRIGKNETILDSEEDDQRLEAHERDILTSTPMIRDEQLATNSVCDEQIEKLEIFEANDPVAKIEPVLHLSVYEQLLDSEEDELQVASTENEPVVESTRCEPEEILSIYERTQLSEDNELANESAEAPTIDEPKLPLFAYDPLVDSEEDEPTSVIVVNESVATLITSEPKSQDLAYEPIVKSYGENSTTDSASDEPEIVSTQYSEPIECEENKLILGPAPIELTIPPPKNGSEASVSSNKPILEYGSVEEIVASTTDHEAEAPLSSNEVTLDSEDEEPISTSVKEAYVNTRITDKAKALVVTVETAAMPVKDSPKMPLPANEQLLEVNDHKELAVTPCTRDEAKIPLFVQEILSNLKENDHPMAIPTTIDGRLTVDDPELPLSTYGPIVFE